MCKKSLSEEQTQMSIATAREMASAIVQREARGPGDLGNAMRRIEQRYGIPYGLLWGLRYRPPKDIMLSAWTALRNAYDAECRRQARRLDHEMQTMKATGHDIDPALVEEISALVRSAMEKHS